MSEIETPTETGADKRAGIDRRAALKKVAVGGAVAWTAPTLLSSKVSAQTPGGFCTPKCRPVQTEPDVSGCTYCVAINSTQFRQAAGLQFTSGSGASCPCGGTPEVAIAANNLVFSQNGSSQFPARIVGDTLVVSGGGGALPQGTFFTLSGSLNAVTSCVDRDGDTYTTQCAYRVTFTFQPNAGACNQVSAEGCSSDVSSISNVGFELVGCVEFCNGSPI